MSTIMTKEQLQEMMSRGLTQEEAWAELGVSKWTLIGALRRLQLRWVKPATRCRRGHDRRVNGYVDAHGQNRCRMCAKLHKHNHYQGVAENKARPQAQKIERVMSGGEVLEKLSHDAAMENAPPWVRHPQPWT